MTWITVNFPFLSESAKSKVNAFVTCRGNGVSKDPYCSFNLASHVQDDKEHVVVNRAILRDELKLPSEPYWLRQTHSTQVLDVPFEFRPGIEADASFTQQSQKVCVVLTADCLPLLIVNDEATEVAAIHAGWRGLKDGIITKTISRMQSKPTSLNVYLGPAIGPSAFEVGEDVKQAFAERSTDFAVCFAKTKNENKFMADLYALAKIEMSELGVTKISGGDYCTYAEKGRFFSYRRDGQTGRMASLIWLS